MRGIRAAASIACLGLGLSLGLAAGCSYTPPADGELPGVGPGVDAQPDADAAMDVYMPACLTSGDYAPRPGTERRYRAFTQSVTYDAATDLCAADGAHLAVVDDLVENTYLVTLFNGGEAWVGFDDLTEEGVFKWVTGAAGYNHYAAPEPTNTSNEDCTALRSSGMWHDVDCGDSKKPICECDPDFRPPPTPLCRKMTAGSFERSGRRVFQGNTPVTWEQAKAACEEIGAHLLVIGDIDENREMDQSINGDAYWIGYTDAVTEGAFTWVTGAPAPFKGWPGGTVPTNGGDDCTLFQDSGSWNDAPCTEPHRYACECDPAPP